MKILFVGITPPQALQQLLLSHGFQIDIEKTLPSNKFPYDLTLIEPKSVKDLTAIGKFRKKCPSSWISLIVDASWLNTSTKHNALLECTDKDDVWPKDYWESLFWPGIQRCRKDKHAKDLLESLSQQASQLQTLYDELSKTSEQLVSKLEQNVDVANQIQRAVLPKRAPVVPGVNISVKYIPATGMGGDYYDIFEFGDKKRFGLMLADSKSHGMAATLLSILLKLRLEEMKERFPSSHDFVQYLNREIGTLKVNENTCMALMYGILDRSTFELDLTVAGTSAPILWRSSTDSLLQLNPNPPLGTLNHHTYRNTKIALKPGDMLLLFSDGLHLPMGQNLQTARARLVKILKSQPNRWEPQELQNEIMAIVDQYQENNELTDDITVMQLNIDPNALYVAADNTPD